MKLATLLLFLTATAALGETAEEMASACKALADAPVSGTVSGKEVKFPHNFETGQCWGAFAAIQGLSRIVFGPVGSIPALKICAPSESTRTQLIAIFVEYVRRNPARLHEDFFVVARDSLSQAFPCKSTQ